MKVLLYLRIHYKFIILCVIFITLRLYQINQPLIEMAEVRQTQTAMITKNLLADNFNVFYTRIDWHGNEIGYYVQEFPLYQTIVALCWSLFGIAEVYGRLISLFFSIIGAIYLFRISRKLFSETIAYYTVLFYAISPLSIFMSRVFMINMASLSLYLVGFYYWLLWFDDKKSRFITIASITFILATLNNVTVGLPFFFPVIYLMFRRWENSKRYYLSIMLFWLFFITLNILWNLHASDINNLYYPEVGGKELFQHIFRPDLSRFDLYSWFRIFMYFLFFVVGFHGLLILLLGVGAFRNYSGANYGILISWLIGAVIYVLVFFSPLRGHNYYLLPTIPVVGILIGISIDHFNSIYKKYNKDYILKLLLLLFLLTIPFWLWVAIKHSTHEDRVSYNAAIAAKKYSKEGELIVVGTLHSSKAPVPVYPTIFYYADRKGWHIAGAAKPDIDTDLVNSLRDRGAKLLVITYGNYEEGSISNKFSLFRKYFSRKLQTDISHQIVNLEKKYKLVEKNSNYALFSL